MLKLHSLYKCYGSECTAGKDQQVLPVLEVYWIPAPKGNLFIVAHLSDQWKALGISKICYELGALQNNQSSLASSRRAVDELTSPLPSQTHRDVAPFYPKIPTSGYFPVTTHATSSAKYWCTVVCCWCCFIMLWKILLKGLLLHQVEFSQCLLGAYMCVKWMYRAVCHQKKKKKKVKDTTKPVL